MLPSRSPYKQQAPSQPPQQQQQHPQYASPASRYGPIAVACVAATFLLTTLSLYNTITTLDEGQQHRFKFLSRGITKRQIEELDQRMKNNDNGSSIILETAAIKVRKGKKRPEEPHFKSSRQVFERDHDPNDFERIQRVVQALRVPTPETFLTANETDYYDVNNCPTTPPQGYPVHWPLLKMLQDWNPDNTEIPATIYQSLCIFDYHLDFDKAQAYRKAEMPFLLVNTPELLRTAERWAAPGYLSHLIGPGTKVRNEYSHNNHLMFWRTVGLRKSEIPKGWKPPTLVNATLSYDEWLKKALVVDESTHPERDEHYYFRLNGDIHADLNAYVYEELPVFHPEEKSIFIVEPEQTRGINCRFGMKGAIAEAHFDWSRNWITVLGGQRRYILGHPKQCQNLNLYPLGHPSARHAQDDWSQVDESVQEHLKNAYMHEIVLQPGDALYLPTAWFHFIVSLNINYQCNARSGTTTENKKYIHEDCQLDVKNAL